VDHITQESTYLPPVSRAPSTDWGQAGADLAPNDVREAKKPVRINTFVGTMVLLSVLLTFSFVVLILSTLAGLRLGNTLLHPSPFGAFEAVWTGQSIASLSEYAQQTIPGHLACLTGASPHQEYLGLAVRVAPGAYNALGQVIKCAAYPKDGMFRVISLTIENDSIQQLEFYSEVLSEDVLLL
jgi:hypothetical protein